MHSLFLKVFLWFWLATALVVLALVISTELTRPDRTFAPRSPTDNAMRVVARTAAEAYERDGQAGLAAYLQLVDKEINARSRLFDEHGAEVSGLGAQTSAAQLASRVAQNAGPVFNRSGKRMLVAHGVSTGAGHHYVFISEHDPPPPPFFDNPKTQALRIFIALVTAGLLCYLLARYIVSPVIKLRVAARQVAGGNLSARVSPQLGKRRDEFAAMGHDFDAMAAQIETLIKTQQRLLRDISHELRSPLARLSVALDLARKRAGIEAVSALDRIEREARRLNEMIGQLLSLARWESDANKLRREPVNLYTLVREVASDADFEARSHNRAVRLIACDECRTTGTTSLLRSAVDNVIRNAVRYTAENTTVDVSLHCLVDGNNECALMRVRDHGEGVPEESLADIFRPFYRVEDARDRESGGTGLGLSITQRAVQLHGGKIKAFNAKDGGLIVEIHLPCALLDGSYMQTEFDRIAEVTSRERQL